MASAARRISRLQDGFSPSMRTAPHMLRRNRPTQIMPTGAGMLICCANAQHCCDSSSHQHDDQPQGHAVHNLPVSARH